MAGSKRRGLGSSLEDILQSLPPAQRHWLTAREPITDTVDAISGFVLHAACAAVSLDVCAYAHRTDGHGVQVQVRTHAPDHVLLDLGPDLSMLLDGPPRDLVLDIGTVPCFVRITHGAHSQGAFVVGRVAPPLSRREKDVIVSLGEALATAAHALDS